MQNKSEINWPWPEELDALTAAPEHHKLLFENESVRVLDACIPLGEITDVHKHKWPSSLYIKLVSFHSVRQGWEYPS